MQKAAIAGTNDGYTCYTTGVKEQGMHIKGGSRKMGEPTISPQLNREQATR